jgi:hypothetical protein
MFVSHSSQGVNTSEIGNQPCKTARSKVVKRARNIFVLVRVCEGGLNRLREHKRDSEGDGDLTFKTVWLLYHFADSAVQSGWRSSLSLLIGDSLLTSQPLKIIYRASKANPDLSDS